MKTVLFLLSFIFISALSSAQNKTVYALRMDTTSIETFSLKARGNLNITEDLKNKNDRVVVTISRGGRQIGNFTYPSITVFNKSRVGSKLRTLAQVKDTVMIEITRSEDKTQLIKVVPVVD
jgi:hypothetical protein